MQTNLIWFQSRRNCKYHFYPMYILIICIYTHPILILILRMRYLTLTNDCSKFEYDTVGNEVILKWNVQQDFVNAAAIGISSLTMCGFKLPKADVMVPIYTNIITRTITNPKRNILNLRIPRHSLVANCQLNMSTQLCKH